MSKIEIEVCGKHISIKWKGKEVRNWFLRTVLLMGGYITVFLGYLVLGGAYIFLVIVYCLAPIWLSMDCILKALGRKGFRRNMDEEGHYDLIFLRSL